MYNQFMGGVDTFDQPATSYKILRRSKKSWKVLFYDLLETVVINAFIIMKEYMANYPAVIVRNSFNQ